MQHSETSILAENYWVAPYPRYKLGLSLANYLHTQSLYFTYDTTP